MKRQPTCKSHRESVEAGGSEAGDEGEREREGGWGSGFSSLTDCI